MADFEDSFAERMRNRALQRLQRNAHILNTDSDFNGEPAFKKRNIPSQNIKSNNKENLNDNLNSINPVKPVIAEHLTVRKSVDKMDVDEPEEIFLRNPKKNTFSEENSPPEKQREDIYVKHCKNRLANLAGKFKQFEEEDSFSPSNPLSENNKQIPAKRRSNEKVTDFGDVSSNKNSKYEPQPRKEIDRAHIFVRPEPRKPIGRAVPSKGISGEQRTPEKTVLDKSVVKSLEAQGYTRTQSDAHLFYDFKAAKSAFDKGNKPMSPIQKKVSEQMNHVAKQPELAKKVVKQPQAIKTIEKKEISNLSSNPKYQSNMFIQNARKVNDVEDNDSTDPSLLSVAERRRLFEKRLRGENVDVPVSFSPVVVASAPVLRTPEKSVSVKLPKPVEQDDYDTDNDYSTCESDDHSGNPTTDGDFASNSETPMSDDDLSEPEHERNCSSESEPEQSDSGADTSVYPVLQTVKEMKFASTPKPGRLYPSVSDLDGEVDEDLKIPKPETNVNENNLDDSFGREVLCATNNIFSSFQNSRKDTSDIVHEKSRNILSEVKDLYSQNNVSLSVSNRSSICSVECANETASFTYVRAYSYNSADISPISVPENTKNSIYQDEAHKNPDDIANDTQNEYDVKEKIKSLEEQIIKEKIQLTQAIRALKFCLSTTFLNSEAHLEAEKLVMLAQLRIVAAQNEIDRIKVENSVQPYSTSDSVRGNVVISNIRLPVKIPVVHADLKEDVYNNLMCVIKCGDTVFATEVVSVVREKIKRDNETAYIEFVDKITVPNVSSDFKISIEVYNLVVEKKDNAANKNNQSSKKEKKTPNSSKKDKKTRCFPRHYTEDKKHLRSSFVMVGYMIFSQNEIQRHQWILNKQDLFHTPLVGMILMEVKCNLSRITIKKHGFLTMYEMISGYGAWCRYWFFLNGDRLSFWKYPEQESTQEPIGSFDLKKCITKDVVVVGYDIVFRPQTFILQFNPPSYLSQFKGLTENRLLLSADTEDERITWCDCLNQVLNSVRSWSNSDDNN